MKEKQIMYKAPVSLIPAIYRRDACGINKILMFAAAYLGCTAAEANERLCCKGIGRDELEIYRTRLQCMSEGSEAYFYIGNKDYWKLRKGEYDDEHCMALAASCAISSIIGEKNFTKTNNNLLLARMSGRTEIRYKTVADKKEQRMRKRTVREVVDGKKKKKVIEEPYMATVSNKKVPDLRPEVEKVNTRRKLDKLKSNMYEWFDVATYGKNTRGYYCSQKLSLEQLIIAVEKKNENNTSGMTYLQQKIKDIKRHPFLNI